ncbi:putative 28kDa heat-and acid-stable phosphoprotein [Helianthus annuus]|nr:putative 28kDa heat-and acid-stable phosphoprotein [Helianthus annuus]KAJ0817554.1 putative 28kDa heat-and acid-stable phosphoprotein [Helianthus annuus]
MIAVAGTSSRPRTFKKEEAEVEEDRSEEESEESSEEESDRKKGTEGVIEIENPNMARPKTLKARDVDVSYIHILDYNPVYYTG